MNKPPNTIIAELRRLGLSLEDAEHALASAKAKPVPAAELAKTVVEAWNKGESSVPIYIAVQLAMAVLDQANATKN